MADNMPILWIAAEGVPMMIVIEEAERLGIHPEKTPLNTVGYDLGVRLRRACLERMKREGRP